MALAPSGVSLFVSLPRGKASLRRRVALALERLDHCVFRLGFQTGDDRVLVHSLVGSAFFGAFAAKILIVRMKRYPVWVLPAAGGLLFSTLILVWYTSALWFFSLVGEGIQRAGQRRPRPKRTVSLCFPTRKISGTQAERERRRNPPAYALPIFGAPFASVSRSSYFVEQCAIRSALPPAPPQLIATRFRQAFATLATTGPRSARTTRPAFRK
jgi:hypothetical protein